MNLKDDAADTAAQALSKVFDQLDNGRPDPADVSAANLAMGVADVFGVTAQDYADRLAPS
ncbi:hypothetical protein AB0G60_02670 [Streptomyces angustmyceticus]|uniref:Uncharacterized protein n=1 Tax=Streptomyces angustmyceticus TaxID=285578 RepID=A0A5J4L528_9ACTN|nr:hypothetical protein [Streptomyces angustmyceticus]UAL65567.1 hypothetical protein K7396_02645 [Streptomyces angustmyceticus]GES27914.1 hypothetical protein San01_04010 [Streptomyces angustmyceticus]